MYPFFIKSTTFRNLSGDEENFDENRTWKQVKIEEVNPSDVSDSETENPENPRGEEEEENQDPQNSNDQNMDLDNQVPPSNPEENTEHEVAQHTNQSNTFLTRCETGRIAEATWIARLGTLDTQWEHQFNDCANSLIHIFYQKRMFISKITCMPCTALGLSLLSGSPLFLLMQF